MGSVAIDTRFAQSGPVILELLKKVKAYGPLRRTHGYEPLRLIVREDNLPAAITAFNKGSWRVLTGNDSFEHVEELTEF